MAHNLEDLKRRRDKLMAQISRMPDTPSREMLEQELANVETLIDKLCHEQARPVHTPRPEPIEPN